MVSGKRGLDYENIILEEQTMKQQTQSKKTLTERDICDCNYCKNVRHPYIKGHMDEHLRNPKSYHSRGYDWVPSSRAMYKDGVWYEYDTK